MENIEYKKGVDEKIKKRIKDIADGDLIPQLSFEEIVELVREYSKVVCFKKGWVGHYLYYRREMLLHLIKQGYTRSSLIKWVRETIGVSDKSAKEYINDVFALISENDKDLIRDARLVAVEQIQQVIQECMENGRYKEALQGYDQLNKISGFYSDAPKIELRDIRFQFGGDEG